MTETIKKKRIMTIQEANSRPGVVKCTYCGKPFGIPPGQNKEQVTVKCCGKVVFHLL